MAFPQDWKSVRQEPGEKGKHSKRNRTIERASLKGPALEPNLHLLGVSGTKTRKKWFNKGNKKSKIEDSEVKKWKK